MHIKKTRPHYLRTSHEDKLSNRVPSLKIGPAGQDVHTPAEDDCPPGQSRHGLLLPSSLHRIWRASSSIPSPALHLVQEVAPGLPNLKVFGSEQALHD